MQPASETLAARRLGRLIRVAEPTRRNFADLAWATLLTVLGVAVFAVALVIVFALCKLSAGMLAHTGLLSFVFNSQWDVVRDVYGALPYIYGILAGIPSVVYGLWGLFVLVPVLRTKVEPFLGSTLGFLPLFRGPPVGLGYLAAGVILAIMILPTITSISIEVLRTVPLSLREAALALGATRWEAIRMAVLPYARAGILGATILGLGRALGETMAVTMVIGNSPTISGSLFAPGYSLPAVIANEFAEASGALHTGALAGLGLILFGVTLLLNVAAHLLVRLSTRGPARVAA